MQPRLQSFIEAVTSTLIGLVVAIVTQLIVFPLYGLEINLQSNVEIAGIFTAVSIVRGYLVRRWFNKWARHTLHGQQTITQNGWLSAYFATRKNGLLRRCSKRLCLTALTHTQQSYTIITCGPLSLSF